jgi:sodium-coupled monocarboxylate transporter 8/12
VNAVKGGMKAVVWTDAFQMITILTGVLALFIKGTMDSGGLSAVWTTAWTGGRIQFAG